MLFIYFCSVSQSGLISGKTMYRVIHQVQMYYYFLMITLIIIHNSVHFYITTDIKQYTWNGTKTQKTDYFLFNKRKLMMKMIFFCFFFF